MSKWDVGVFRGRGDGVYVALTDGTTTRELGWEEAMIVGAMLSCASKVAAAENRVSDAEVAAARADVDARTPGDEEYWLRRLRDEDRAWEDRDA